MPPKNQDKAREASPQRAVAKEIHDAIAAKFGDAVELHDAVDPFTVVKDPLKFLEIMTWLRDDPSMDFDFLRSVTGVDYPDDERIASVYHLWSYGKKRGHTVKYLCERESPEVPTVMELWPTANWFERETYDLLGIIYLSHTDLRRLLLPDDWEGFPLRKDYAEAADYHGIGTTRASPLDAFAQMDEARRKAGDERGEEVPPPQKSSIVAPEKKEATS